MYEFNELESAVMEMFLAGRHPVWSVLRKQWQCARLKQRVCTGVGFFAEFEIPASAPLLEHVERWVLDDIQAEMDGLALGAGFLLFIQAGRLSMLEGYCYEEVWPESKAIRRLYYTKKLNGSLTTSVERDESRLIAEMLHITLKIQE